MQSDDARQDQAALVDAGLVERVRAGDDTAFAALVGRYRDVVCGLAFHYLQNGEDAQDAAQETFIHVYLHLFQLREANHFAPWLRRMTVNHCLDRLRQRRRRECLPSLTADAGRDNITERLIRRLFVQQAMATLSDKVRLTVTLCYIGEYSHDEIARFLNVPVGTVRSRLRYAKQQLRQEMKSMAEEVEEVLEEARPGPDWTRQVVEEAVRAGQAALHRHARGEALVAFDTALGALDTLDATLPIPEKNRLLLSVLRQKDTALGYSVGSEGRLSLLQEALVPARALRDSQAEAELLVDMGRVERDQEKAAGHYAAALSLFRKRGDLSRQAQCLLYLGATALFQADAGAGKAFLSEALPFFEATEAAAWQGVCHALLKLLAETEVVGLDKLLLWAGMCDTLDVSEGRVAFANQPGFQMTRRNDASENAHPSPLFTGSVFWQLSALRTFLDTSVVVGGDWEGSVPSFSFQPLTATMRVVSVAEHVRVPAGDFEGCLLMELVTHEGDQPDAAPERVAPLEPNGFVRSPPRLVRRRGRAGEALYRAEPGGRDADSAPRVCRYDAKRGLPTTRSW